MKHTVESLRDFEQRVADAFLAKKVSAPVHLSGGNEAALLSIFEDVKKQDWVFSTWRSHYHALLKGIPERWIMDEVLAGRSMYLMNKEHNFFSSAIVGGILPIACGVAMGIKREISAIVRIPGPGSMCRDCGGITEHQRWCKPETVWVFVGDMTARTGIFHEFLSYCDGHALPVTVVIEDNGLSTNTPTVETWGNDIRQVGSNVRVIRYRYERTRPHVGIGQHVTF